MLSVAEDEREDEATPGARVAELQEQMKEFEKMRAGLMSREGNRKL